jgi:hypothetical protein
VRVMNVMDVHPAPYIHVSYENGCHMRKVNKVEAGGARQPGAEAWSARGGRDIVRRPCPLLRSSQAP